MSNAAAANATEAAPPARSKKTLIIIIAAVVVLALVGVGAMLLLKKKPAEGEEGEEAEAPPAKAAKADPKAVPTFAPLDNFVVNLADREAERYAQIGITLEITDAKAGDQIKVFMPAIRHAVLMILADKTAAQLMDRAGKEQLARQIQRETSRVLGADVEDLEGDAAAEAAEDPKKDAKKSTKKKKKKAAAELPVRAVHFSSFIVQ